MPAFRALLYHVSTVSVLAGYTSADERSGPASLFTRAESHVVVPVTPYYNGIGAEDEVLSYTMEVEIGGTDFRLTFDTGSEVL